MQFTAEERASPELAPYIKKAEKRADKLEAAKEALPKKRVVTKETVYDEAKGKAKSRLYFDKQSSYKGKSPLPDFVIDAACAGNAEAVERVLQHYDGYINKLCTRTLYDGSGQPHICIDEYMKRRLQIKLIHSIVSPIGD